MATSRNTHLRPIAARQPSLIRGPRTAARTRLGTKRYKNLAEERNDETTWTDSPEHEERPRNSETESLSCDDDGLDDAFCARRQGAQNDLVDTEEDDEQEFKHIAQTIKANQATKIRKRNLEFAKKSNKSLASLESDLQTKLSNHHTQM